MVYYLHFVPLQIVITESNGKEEENNFVRNGLLSAEENTAENMLFAWMLMMWSVVRSHQKLTPLREEKPFAMDAKILEIIEKEFATDDTLVIYTGCAATNQLNSVSKHLHRNRVLVLVGNALNPPPSETFLIQFCNLTDLHSFLSVVNLNQKQKFLIATNGETDVASIAEIFWTFRLSNFAVITEDMKVYTWYPYSDTHCGDGFDEIEEVTKRVFDEKMDNLKRCPIRVRMQYAPPLVINEEEGAQIELVKTISEKLNFTAIIELHTDNHTEFDTDYLLRGLNQEYELALPLDALYDWRHFYYDYSDWYFEDSDVFCVKYQVEAQAKWLKLGEILISHYYYMAPPLVCYVIINFIFTKVLNRRRQFLNIFQEYLSVVLGAPNNILPIDNCLRILLSSWMIFTLIFSINFTSVLFGKFQQPIYVTQYFSQKMFFLLMLLPIYFNRQLLSLLQYMSYNFDEYNKQRFVVCNDLMDCVRRVVVLGDAVVSMKRTVLSYNTYKFITRLGSSQMSCYRYVIDMNYMRIFMAKNHQLKSGINRVLRHLTQAKIFNERLDQMVHANKWKDLMIWAKTRISMKTVTKGLDFHDFTVIFIYIVCGLIIATAVFLCEIFYHRFGPKIRAFLRGNIIM